MSASPDAGGFVSDPAVLHPPESPEVAHPAEAPVPHAVLRAPVPPGTVADRDLDDPEPGRLREVREEAVDAVQRQEDRDHLAPERLQRAGDVADVAPEAGVPRAVRDAGGRALHP